MFVRDEALAAACAHFRGQAPFDHCVVDDFFEPEIAMRLESEFPKFEGKIWHEYLSPIEIKRTCNDWNVFPPMTYKVISHMNSEAFCRRLGGLLGIADLSADPGLNGGGLHSHGAGGKLNTHLDYNLHPKLGRRRKLNIIIYLNSRWRPEWGGQLGFWGHDPQIRGPGALIKSVDPVFNRAVLFDTTQNSWHGLPAPLRCPDGEARQSIAIYYLVPAAPDEDPRGKALFAPTAEQADDPRVLELIRRRADATLAASAYRS
jgi:hypothetical protein